MFRKAIVLIILLCCAAGVSSYQAKAVDIGLGVEYLSQLGPQLAGQLGFGNWAIQSAFTGSSFSEQYEDGTLTFSVAYLSLIAKYHIPIGPVKAYIGVGGIAAGVALTGQSGNVSIDAASGVASGQTLILGADYKLSNLPIAFYGGVSYLNFSELEVEVFGVTETFALDSSGIAVHLGVKLAFSLGGGGDRESSDDVEEQDSEDSTESEQSDDTEESSDEE